MNKIRWQIPMISAITKHKDFLDSYIWQKLKSNPDLSTFIIIIFGNNQKKTWEK